VSIHLGPVLFTAFVTALVSLLVTECYQTTPWLANKLMRWSVRLRYADNPERATIRGEELIGLLEDLPTLFKLPTAAGFLLHALAYRLTSRGRDTYDILALYPIEPLILALYFLNCFTFSEWPSLLTSVTGDPWLRFSWLPDVLTWLYGLIALMLLASRHRAPVIVFVVQLAVTAAAWPSMFNFFPIAGIPVALHAVSCRRNRAISLLALLVSITVMELGIVARGRMEFFFNNTQRLHYFLPDAIIVAFVTVGAWGVGRIARASQLHVQHCAEPQVGQLSLGARFSITVVKALLVAVCAGTCFGLEFRFAITDLPFLGWGDTVIEPDLSIPLFGSGAGILAAIELTARRLRFCHGLIGGIATIFLMLATITWFPPRHPASTFIIPLSIGVTFGVATALTYVIVRRFKRVGVVIVALVNGLGIALMMGAGSFPSIWLPIVAWWSGIGIAVGVLAGSAAAVERRMRRIGTVPIPIFPPISLSNPEAVTQHPQSR
jgi:hypothetical protein